MFILRWPGAEADIFVWTVQAVCMSCSFNQNAPISFSFQWYSLNECVYFSEIYWFSACVLSHCFKFHSRLYWYNLNIYNALKLVRGRYICRLSDLIVCFHFHPVYFQIENVYGILLCQLFWVFFGCCCSFLFIFKSVKIVHIN